jgi:hypothetical protein
LSESRRTSLANAGVPLSYLRLAVLGIEVTLTHIYRIALYRIIGRDYKQTVFFHVVKESGRSHPPAVVF